MNDERPNSMAARELGQLRQSHHPVSRLREEVRFQTESIASDQSGSGALSTQNSSVGDDEHDDNHHVQNASREYEIRTNRSMGDEPDEQDSGQSVSTSSTESGNGVQHEADLPWSRDISVAEDGQDDSSFLDREEEWHVIESHEEEPQWQLSPSLNSTRNRFSSPPEDDDVYGVELRELLSRRSVSNLLRSGFRQSLDQLIQSYVERQEHDWDFQGQRPSTSGVILNEDPIEIRMDEPAVRDERPQAWTTGLSDEALFPSQQRQREWQIDNWSQQAMHRSEFQDWDAVNVLRDEVSGVQRGMSSMQQMLEACMEMQIELQRSIKQEVSAALNRSLAMPADEETLEEDGSQWKLARKGTCCICCDNQIDSLLYRCGHMCTCSKCAGELLHGVGKCPLCRAPIVEVIRAYCIM
ncbi:E3 ubiquitin-protein ligase LRSAM1-like isoform X1 [Panicum hallii]|uniref:E3 ubiquitin-protein ligase LRSAM1-like isoform X1 n=1 Tax=Panicum hallii TaxID=206008 RepID=UPI000DF4D6C3|nr:E3 ubiquitin-protein ligase LRSAM1-like isoform X1 [Panicum hallii]